MAVHEAIETLDRDTTPLGGAATQEIRNTGA